MAHSTLTNETGNRIVLGVNKALVLIALLGSLGNPLVLCPGIVRVEGGTSQEVDRVGPYVIGNTKDRTKNEATVRDFLWSHWRQHRTGSLRAVWISKEGNSATTTYSLGFDKGGIWNLRVTTLWPPQKGADLKHSRTEFAVYSIRRIEPRHDGQSPAVLIPEGEARPGNTYRLVFYDKDGKETGGV